MPINENIKEPTIGGNLLKLKVSISLTLVVPFQRFITHMIISSTNRMAVPTKEVYYSLGKLSKNVICIYYIFLLHCSQISTFSLAESSIKIVKIMTKTNTTKPYKLKSLKTLLFEKSYNLSCKYLAVLMVPIRVTK